MTDAELDALIGRTLQEHRSLKQKLACLATKADQMQNAIAQGLRLIKGETTGHFTNGSLVVAKEAHTMRVANCDWPSVEAIGGLVTERNETEKRLTEIEGRLREMGMGDYAA